MITGSLDRPQTKITRRLIGTDRIDAFQLGEHRAARFGLLRLLSGQVAADELFGFRNQLLLIVVGTLLGFTPLFAFHQVIRIVAGITGSAPVLELNNAAASAIEKIPIVRNDNEAGRAI